MKIQFNDIFVDCTSDGTKIPKELYLKNGKYVIIDQGQNQIAGFTNQEDGVYSDVPAIIFGDHTRVIKYVDEPFFLGADGVKLLKSTKKDVNYKYLYYALLSLKVLNLGYNRHFKLLKESNIEYCDINTQNSIVKILDKINSIIQKHKKVINHLDTLIKARFVEMFGKRMENDEVMLSDIAEFVIGLTYKPENVSKNGIIVLRSGNILNNSLQLKNDVVRVSDVSIPKNKYIKKNDILMCARNGSARLVGKSCLISDVKEDMSFGAFMTVIRSEYPYFLQSFFSSQYFIRQLTSVATTSVNQITTYMLNGYKTIKPTDDEENTFATFVKHIDKLKFDVQKSLEKTQMLFDGLMQRYFG